MTIVSAGPQKWGWLSFQRILHPEVAGAAARPDDGQRLPGIEGLRGVAILLVLLFKFTPSVAPGGWLGVDLFFVISGFVITRRILTDIAAERFSLGSFYLARARRLLPALLAMLVATAIAGALIMTPVDFIALAKDIGPVAVGLGNIHFWRSINYWRTQSGLALLHGWSLGVEEQFYLLYPLLLLGAARRRWNLPVLLGVGFVGSVLLFFFCLARAPMAAFYLLPPRAWELLVGALLAVVPRRRQWTPVRRDLTAGCGGAAILIALLSAESEHVFQGYLAVPVCLGAGALILGASRPTDGLVGRLLAMRPARFLGRISYSVYLWHMPILILWAYRALATPGRSVRIGLLLLTIIVATASYRWIETPFRRRRLLARPRRFVLVSGLALAGMLFALLGVIVGGGLPGRWPIAARPYVTPQRVQYDSAACEIPGGLGNCRPGQPLDLLVWGDSHTGGITSLASRLTQASGAAIGFAHRGGCSPLPGLRVPAMPTCAPWTDSVMDWVDRHPVRTILIAERWIHATHTGPLAAFDAGDGVTVHGLEASVLAMRAFVAHLKAAGIRVIVMEPTPVFDVPIARQQAYLAAAGRPVDRLALSRADYEQEQAAFRTLIGDLVETGQIEILRTDDLYCDAIRCPATRDGIALFWDTNHMTSAGYEILAPRLLELVRTLRVNASDRSEPRADASGTAARP